MKLTSIKVLKGPMRNISMPKQTHALGATETVCPQPWMLSSFCNWTSLAQGFKRLWAQILSGGDEVFPKYLFQFIFILTVYEIYHSTSLPTFGIYLYHVLCLPTLLKYNLHSTTSPIVSVKIHDFSKCIELCNYQHNPILDHFHYFEKFPHSLLHLILTPTLTLRQVLFCFLSL